MVITEIQTALQLQRMAQDSCPFTGDVQDSPLFHSYHEAANRKCLIQLVQSALREEMLPTAYVSSQGPIIPLWCTKKLLLLEGGKATSLGRFTDPERSKTYEIGARFEGGNLKTDLTLFLINFDNQIEFDSTVGQNVNKGETEHKGVEIAFSYDMKEINPKLEGLSVYGTYAYTDARRESGDFKGNDLRLYSPHTGTIGTRYQYQDWTFNVNGYAQSQQYSDDANTSEESSDGKNGIIPGFAILDIRAAKSFDWDERQLEIGVGVKNILDRRHFTRASIENNGGIFVGAPRTIFTELKATF